MAKDLCPHIDISGGGGVGTYLRLGAYHLFPTFRVGIFFFCLVEVGRLIK